MIKSSFNFAHKPVLLNELINLFPNKKNTIFIDGTFGDGGHTKALLEKNKTCKVYAIDRDPDVLENVEFFLKKYNTRFKFILGKISDLEKISIEENLKNNVDGIFFDLGVSTRQLKDSARGFSFQNDGPLDMRMGQSGQTAEEFLNSQTEKKISDVIYKYGEERASRKISKAIIKIRKKTPIHRTKQLAEIICKVIPSNKKDIHPATKTFQAFRIYINHELDEIREVLPQATDVLCKGGRLAAISFHSLEDRIVKRFMRDQSKPKDQPLELPVAQDYRDIKLKLVGKKIRPSEDEVSKNQRSRSALLRVAERC